MTKKLTQKESKYLNKQLEKMEKSKDKDEEVPLSHATKVALKMVGY